MAIKNGIHRQQPEAGISAILLIIVFMVGTSIMLWQTTDGLFSSAKISKGSSEGERFSANIIARSKKLLQKNAGCTTTIANKFAAFRKFSMAAPTIRINLQNSTEAVPCVILASEQSFLDPSKPSYLEISEQMNDANLLTKQVRIDLSIHLKKIKGVPVRSVKRDRTVRVRVASADYFNIILRGNNFPLITTAGPFLDFTGAVFYSTNAPLALDDVLTDLSTKNIRFSQPFFVRHATLLAVSDQYNWDDLKMIFSRGVETGSLDHPFVNNYLPSNTNPWNHGFDYSYLVAGTGFSLPEVQGGFATTACGTAAKYQPAFGSINKVPEPSGGLPSADFSCQETLSPVPTFVYMKVGQDLTIDLKSSDNVFCGLVTARTLTINAPSAGHYALFGNFFVEKIVVTGHADAVVHFHNPQDNLPLDVSFSDNQTQQNMVDQFKRIASSTAYNFFSPMSQAGHFLPRSPNDYMVAGMVTATETCSSTEYKYRSEYLPITGTPAFSTYRNNTAGAAYIVEDDL